MVTIAQQKQLNAPRFMKLDAKIVYDLFDAFIKATLLDDKAIDFSKPVTKNEDGSYEFACCDEKFSELVHGNARISMVKVPNKPVAPKMPKKKESQSQAEYDREVAKIRIKEAEYPAKLAAYETAVAIALEKKEADLNKNALLYAHLNWLWTLCNTGSKTTCGADNLKVLGFEEKGDAFSGKIGLWKANATNMKKEMDFICNVLFRFATLSDAIKKIFPTVMDIKQALVEVCEKVMSREKISMRNGMLHLCDPNRYIHLYTVEEKILVVAEHKGYLLDFKDPYNKYDKKNSLYYKDEKTGYRHLTTEAQLCHIDDILRSIDAVQGMSQEEFWTRYFYSFKDRKAREEAIRTIVDAE